MKNYAISILGCGWLGLPLALNLIEKNHSIRGSTTTESKLIELEKKGIEPHLLKISDQQIIGSIDPFLQSDILIINIPPKRIKNIEHYYQNQMTLLVDKIKKSTCDNILFISSTSVFGNEQKHVTNDTTPHPEKASGKALVNSEILLKELIGDRLTILRFSGLIGPNRHPGKFLAGKTDLCDGPVNLIHMDDCIGFISAIISQRKWGFTFNASSDKAPLKSEFYVHAAKKSGLKPPIFNSKENGKVIENHFIKQELNYSMIVSDIFNAI